MFVLQIYDHFLVVYHEDSNQVLTDFADELFFGFLAGYKH